MPFQPLAANSPFTSITQDTVTLLESVKPSDKGMAVPRIVMWQVDRTGKPIHGDTYNRPTAPLSLQFVTPPRFGASMMDGHSRYRERPPVSLERISIKWQNPNGVIAYRVLKLNFMIHRPDVIFNEIDPTIDNFVSMIIPGNIFVLEYGWRAGQGVKNGLLNGEGYNDQQGHIVPGTLRVKFTVTSYNFRIQPDNQISMEIDAYEDGEFNVRQSLIVDVPPKSVPVSGQKNPIAEISDPYQDPLFQGFLQQARDRIRSQVKPTQMQGQQGFTDLVKFQDICDILFAPVIEGAYRRLGYDQINLYMGYFNERVGTPAPQYGLLPPGTDPSGKPLPSSIGSFQLPMKEVEGIFNSIMTNGQQLTMYNFMIPFFKLLNDFPTWDRTNAPKDKNGVQQTTLPEIAIKTINNKGTVNFYMVDLKREHSRFASSDQLSPEQLVGGKVTRSAIKNVCKNAGVPFVSFQKGNSYIQESSFNVIADEQIKSIFQRRYLNQVRQQITETPDVQQKLKTGVDARQVLYSSAIAGDITMLGNFAFDIFQLIWLDFGAERWDGPFRVQEREDTIEAGSFLTKIHVISEGNDPLGTQGRLDQTPRGTVVAGLPVTGGSTAIG
jgi:hypothetical protein